MNIFDLFKSLINIGGKTIVSLETSRKIKKDWDNIEIMLLGGAPSQLKQSLIQADKLLDNALKDIVAGDTMGARLKNARGIFERYFYQKLWDAHRLRNNMVHEIGFDPPHFLIREAVMAIKAALVKLGVAL